MPSIESGVAAGGVRGGRARRLLPAGVWTAIGAVAICTAADTNGLRRVEFREPRATAYLLERTEAGATAANVTGAWTRAWRADGSTNFVELSSRVVLQVKSGTDLNALLKGRAVQIDRQLDRNLVILQAASSAAAIDEAEFLAKQPGVRASYPVMRRSARLQSRYATQPNDPYFPKQWHLENRDTNGLPKGIDLNARATWSVTQGEGVLVADADDGIELTHPELTQRAQGQPHFNFDTGLTDGSPESTTADHGTAVAGIIAAEGNNDRGVIGVAPQAGLASWVIFASSFHRQEQIVSDEALMDMFQYASNQVAVQNHSWASFDTAFSPLDSLSDIGISNAVTHGRSGLGVVLVRAGGNDRENLINVNDDGFGNDPRAIAVAAARFDGRACSYSSPGACLLVGAPSGDPLADGTEDPNAPNIVTTDRQGSLGYNSSGPADSADYCFGNTGFDGTSASSPQVAGVAALILAANPNLSYRDVQHILLQSARHYDFADPDVRTNGAGFLVSHNLGFGVPDAGFAVALAQHWSNRPPAIRLTVESTATQSIPTNALRVVCQGPGLSDVLTSLNCWPCLGPHPDAPTAARPLVYVGQANSDLTQDLHGKGALIQRGVSVFSDKITRAARAGAEFAVVFNNINATELILMAGTTFVPIPAVFIDQNDGEALRDYVQAQTNHTAQLRLTPATITFIVTNAVICEHVGIALETTAPVRGDLRITLVSPAGTRSVLQAVNNDGTPGPTDWTYWSVHCFYESSIGQWRLEVSNEQSSDTGSVTDARLIIEGVPIADSDHDGLDDNWEMKWFGTLAHGPQDNPSGDGYSLARKQCLNIDPAEVIPLLSPDVSFWDNRLARVSFPAKANQVYQVGTAADLNHPFAVLTNVTGRLPEIEIFFPYVGTPNQFFRAMPAAAR